MEGFSSLLFIGVIIAFMYVLLVRPQKRQQRVRQGLIDSLAPGDKIVTIGGMYGTVREMDDSTVKVELAEGTVVTMVKRGISHKVTEEEPPADEAGQTSPDGEEI